MRTFITVCVALALLTVSAPPCRAESSTSGLIPYGHWVYDAMSYLAVETGETTLAVNSPSSYGELRVYFSAIKHERLSTQGASLYDKVGRFLQGSTPLYASGNAGSSTGGNVTVDVRPVISVSGILRQNDDAQFSFESLERFNETKPFVSIPVSIGFTPYVTAFADFTLKKNYWTTTLDATSTNVPLGTDSFDANMPSSAYITAGNGFMSATIGRGALNQGRTVFGSMSLSPSCDRLDYASLVLFSPKLRVSITPVELAPDRYAYFHDVSFRPFPFLSLSVSEAAMVHSTLDLRYLNPAMIFHNYAGWRDDYGQEVDESPVGTQFTLSADLVPIRGLRLYGQFALNQFQTSFELSKYEDSAEAIPNALGGLAGAEYIRGFRDGFLVATAEGIWTNPWLYTLSNPDISFIWSRRELVAPSGYTKQDVTGYLGTPYGPDTLAGIIAVAYDVPLTGKISFRYRATRKGGEGIGHSVECSAERQIGEKFEVGGMVGYSIIKRDAWSQSAEAAVSVSWKLR